jgi:diadenosine tetraphosphatase ApaH/serine/threonine PP2A family protein phosphatase
MSTQALKGDKTIQGLSTYTDSIRITHEDLTTAGTGQTITLAVKAGQQVRAVAYKLHTAFSGGSLSSFVIDVGDGADADGYIDNANVFTGAGSFGPALDGVMTGKTYAADDTIDILFTGSGNVNTADAGDIEIFFNIFDVDSIAGRQVS